MQTPLRILRLKSVRKLDVILLALLVASTPMLGGCRSKTENHLAQPVTITFVGWGPATLKELTTDRSIFAKFTQDTGIQVNFIVGPESMTDRLHLYQDAFQRKSSSPDVLYTDVVWPGVLADHLVDLNPYLRDRTDLLMPTAVQNNTVDGRLVAMPFNIEVGLLYYRTDLLAKYGFKHPPATWLELAQMARRIQDGERAAGHKDFWGYVWEGAPYEGLTCDALEWQVSYGGGKIIEDDGTISVNNPQTIQSLKMARSWVGSISPPSVLAFKESDARNIWDSGNAAFRRDWVWRGNPPGGGADALLLGKFSTTLPPSGGAGPASVLGGQSLAVSRYSAHPREAAQLVRYLTSRDVQLWLWQKGSMLSALNEFYQDPQYLAARPDLARWKDILTGSAVTRPSTVTGKHYAAVSQAYYSSVHSVLTGEVTPEKAMSDLEAVLIRITSFKPGKPPRPKNPPDKSD